MKIKAGQENAYKEWIDNNRDAYGRACFAYAERWAELLEKKVDEIGDAKKAIVEHAEYLSREADTDEIAMSMFACAVNILAQCWVHGKELRKWYNKQYGYESEIIRRIKALLRWVV